MFYSLNGSLIYKDPSCAVIECAGVGYKCICSYNTYKKLPKVGEPCVLLCHLVVREDSADLYGFAGQEEQDCFKMLTGVSGVGVKSAMAILSDLDPDSFALCVASGDARRIQKAPGIGAKTAQRIILELKDKVGAVSSGASALTQQLSASGGAFEEALEALASLGYTRTAAAGALAGLSRDLPVEQLIKEGLKKLSGRF